jgi:hypothetical protein
MSQRGLINSYIQKNLVPIDQGKLVATNPIIGKVQVHEIHTSHVPVDHPAHTKEPSEKEHVKEHVKEHSEPTHAKEEPIKEPSEKEHKIEDKPVKLEHPELSEKVDNTLKLPIPDGVTPNQAVFALPPRIRERFVGGRTVEKGELLPKLKNGLNSFSRDMLQISKEDKKAYKMILKNIISSLENVPNNVRISFNVLEGNGVFRTLEEPQLTQRFSGTRDNIPFGKFLIDKRQLGSGVLALQYKNRRAIPTMPNRKISKHLSNAIYSITIGKNPNLNYLLPEEEAFLKHLIDKS